MSTLKGTSRWQSWGPSTQGPTWADRFTIQVYCYPSFWSSIFMKSLCVLNGNHWKDSTRFTKKMHAFLWKAEILLIAQPKIESEWWWLHVMHWMNTLSSGTEGVAKVRSKCNLRFLRNDQGSSNIKMHACLYMLYWHNIHLKRSGSLKIMTK